MDGRCPRPRTHVVRGLVLCRRYRAYFQLEKYVLYDIEQSQGSTGRSLPGHVFYAAFEAECRYYRGALRCRCFRSEEHTSELPSLMRISSAVFCLKQKTHIYCTIILYSIKNY